MSDTFDLTFEVTVRLVVRDPDVIQRVLDNHDGQHQPQPRAKGGRGWEDFFYNLLERDDVLEMLGRCCGIKGWDLSSLDGWSDLPDNAVEAHEVGIELLQIDEVPS